MLPVSIWTHLAALICGISVSWYVASSIATKKELAALQKIEDAREAERKRNAEISVKHASDLYQVLDHYRRNPSTVRVLSPCPDPGEPAGGVDVPAESVTVSVGGVKPGNGSATDSGMHR